MGNISKNPLIEATVDETTLDPSQAPVQDAGNAADEGQNSNTADAAGSTEVTKSPEAEALAGVNEQISDIASKLESLTSIVAQSAVAAQNQQPAVAEPTYAADPLPEDIEGLSREQYTQVLDNRIQKTVVAPINAAIKTLNETQTRLMVQVQIGEARRQHEDFDKWIPEMRTVAQTYPEINPVDAYKLAVQGNPEKVAKLAAVKPPENSQNPNPNPNPQAPPQGTPTGGDATPSQKMSFSEALEFGISQNSADLDRALADLDAF